MWKPNGVSLPRPIEEIREFLNAEKEVLTEDKLIFI